MKTILLTTYLLLSSATTSIAASELGPLKLLGRGLENQANGDVLQLQCIGASDESGEASCELLQPILSRVDGGVLAIGSPEARESKMAEGYSDIRSGAPKISVTYWEKLFRLNRRLEIYHQWESDVYNGYNPATYRKTTELPDGDWQTAQSLRDRNTRLWQFRPLSVSAHDFKNLIRVITVDDESQTRSNHCPLAGIQASPPVTGDSGESFLSESILQFLGDVPSVSQQTSRGKYGSTALPESAAATLLLREFYDFRPAEAGFTVQPIYTKPDSRDHGKRIGLGTSVTSCLALKFTSQTGQVFETKKYCKSSVKHRWKAFLRSFPSCSELAR